MKYLSILVVFVLLVACTNVPRPVVINTEGNDSLIATPVMRYFFVGYMATDGNQIAHGNFFHIENRIPIMDSLKKWAYEYGIGETSIPPSRVNIVGFYEFKDSLEYAKFRNK